MENVFMNKQRPEEELNTSAPKTLDAGTSSEILGISVATIRNWARLKKITPVSTNPLLFSEKDVYELHKSLDNSNLLKSRRNKSRAAGTFVPGSYISKSSPNYAAVKKIIGSLEGIDTDISMVLAYYGKSLLIQRRIPDDIITRLINPLNGSSDADTFECTFLPDDQLKFIDGEDTLGLLYLSLRNLREKKSTGSYYTSFFVVDELTENLDKTCKMSGKDICDPACGSGNFLLRLPGDILLKNIHGYDIDETAIYLARINLSLKYEIADLSDLEILENNLISENFLIPHNTPVFPHFDIILGNPPWGYTFTKDDINLLRHSFTSLSGQKQPESFALFVEQSLKLLKKDAVLSFLLPETILGADTHTGIRTLVLGKAHVTSLTYLDEVFERVQCPSIILTLINNHTDNNSSDQRTFVSFISLSDKKRITGRAFDTDSNRLRADSFHILCDDKQKSLLDKISSSPHFTLKGNAEFALGIVTGSNRTLLKSSKSADLEPILKGKDIEKFGIRKATSFVRYDPASFQQCAKTQFYKADEKLFYRFIADEPIFALDRNGLLSLNSANIVIPKTADYPAPYIMAILNSKVIGFFYKNSFKNMKVLRSYLEQLPITVCDDKDKETITDIALKLSGMDTGSASYNELSHKLDMEVCRLYHLTPEEMNMIFQ